MCERLGTLPKKFWKMFRKREEILIKTFLRDYKKVWLLTSKAQREWVTTLDFYTPLHNFKVVTERFVFVTDFCQVELRLLAHFSSDLELLRIFTDPQADVFTMLASQWCVSLTHSCTPRSPCQGDRCHTAGSLLLSDSPSPSLQTLIALLPWRPCQLPPFPCPGGLWDCHPGDCIVLLLMYFND